MNVCPMNFSNRISLKILNIIPNERSGISPVQNEPPFMVSASSRYLIWSVQEESTTTPFCVDELSFQPTYDGVLLQSKSSTSTTPSTTTTATSSTNLDDDTNVQICTTGSSSSTGFDDLPLYGKVNNKCTFHQDSSTTTLMFHSIDHANDRFPPSFQRIREQYQTLFLNNKKSIHIIGDSHQRYMYAGLVDLANHNCM